jgi:pyrroline-5-carboxylate reductase
MNPSASTIVNKGVNPISFSGLFNHSLKQVLMELVNPLGYIPEVADSKIEAYAVISAMGHTYFNFQLQKLKELAVSFGMDETEAAKTISHMLWGTTETLFYSGLTFDEVNDLVPVKPMSEVEETIKGYYDLYLNGIYQKIRP